MIINNDYEVFISVCGIELFDSGKASKVNCKITEDVVYSMPTCSLTFLSSREFLDGLPIVDGAKVTIQIKSNTFNINENLYFRVANMKTMANGNNMIYNLDCVIDFYELFRDPIKYSMNNNSSEIFKKIMNDNGLIGSVHQTKDKQLWAPSEGNLGQWLSYIAAHAWSSPQSGFYWFMNREKNMFFLDIDKLIYESKDTVKFVYGDTMNDDVNSRTMRYKNLAIDTRPGEENLFNRGYDGANSHFDLLSYSTKHINANKVRAVSEIVNINKELSQGLGKNILQFDIGNHHENFFLAEAQNRRVLSTFSSYIALSCESYRPLKLSQVCTIQTVAPNNSNSPINTFDIKYIVDKIVTHISSSTINMEVELCSQGYNGSSTESY